MFFKKWLSITVACLLILFSGYLFRPFNAIFKDKEFIEETNYEGLFKIHPEQTINPNMSFPLASKVIIRVQAEAPVKLIALTSYIKIRKQYFLGCKDVEWKTPVSMPANINIKQGTYFYRLGSTEMPIPFPSKDPRGFSCFGCRINYNSLKTELQSIRAGTIKKPIKFSVRVARNIQDTRYSIRFWDKGQGWKPRVYLVVKAYGGKEILQRPNPRPKSWYFTGIEVFSGHLLEYNVVQNYFPSAPAPGNILISVKKDGKFQKLPNGKRTIELVDLFSGKLLRLPEGFLFVRFKTWPYYWDKNDLKSPLITFRFYRVVDENFFQSKVGQKS